MGPAAPDGAAGACLAAYQGRHGCCGSGCAARERAAAGLPLATSPRRADTHGRVQCFDCDVPAATSTASVHWLCVGTARADELPPRDLCPDQQAVHVLKVRLTSYCWANSSWH